MTATRSDYENENVSLWQRADEEDGFKSLTPEDRSCSVSRQQNNSLVYYHEDVAMQGNKYVLPRNQTCSLWDYMWPGAHSCVRKRKIVLENMLQPSFIPEIDPLARYYSTNMNVCILLASILVLGFNLDKFTGKPSINQSCRNKTSAWVQKTCR